MSSLNLLFCAFVSTDFFYFWSWVFMITTTLVWIMKKELPEKGIDKDTIDVVSSYKGLWKILQLPSIKTIILFLLTVKVCN